MHSRKSLVRELSGKSLLNYYAPLKEWLMSKTRVECADGKNVKKQILLITGSIFKDTIYSQKSLLFRPQRFSRAITRGLILANPGDIIQLTTGIYNFEDSLSLDIDGVGHAMS